MRFIAYTILLCAFLCAPISFAGPNLADSGVKYTKQLGYVATATAGDDVWVGDGVYPFQTAAAAITIVSDSSADAAAGTGCRTVYVEGLASDYDYQAETVTMNGTNAVTLANEYLRINRAKCMTVGSGGVNAGVIDVKVSSTVLARMPARMGLSQQAVYSVPGDTKGSFLESWDFSVGASTSAQATVGLQIREFGGSWVSLDSVNGNDTAGVVRKEFGSWMRLPPKSDVRLQVISVGVAIGSRVNGNLEIMEKP